MSSVRFRTGLRWETDRLFERVQQASRLSADGSEDPSRSIAKSFAQ